MSTRERFRIGCGKCGFVGSSTHKWTAKSHAAEHFHGPEVNVFDVMARRGAAQQWNYTGSQWVSGQCDVKPGATP